MPTNSTPDPALSRLESVLTPELRDAASDAAQAVISSITTASQLEGLGARADAAWRNVILTAIGAWWEAERQAQQELSADAIRAQAIDYSELDPGIRDVVRRVREAGFVTTDSGDGVTKPRDEQTFDLPHVACVVTPDRLVSEAHRLRRVLGDDWTIEASYDPEDESAILFATSAVARTRTEGQ